MVRGNFFYKRLGDKIIDNRKKMLLSQEQLAMLSEIDRTYIARLEEGKANPTIKILNKIARALKTRLSILLKGV